MSGYRTSGLPGILSKLLSGYYFLVDKASDNQSKKLAVENFLPGRFDLIQIGSWNMNQSLSTIINVLNASEIIAAKVISIIDDNGLIYDAAALYDSYFHGQLLQIGKAAITSVQTDTQLSSPNTHAHNVPARNPIVTGSYQGRNISIMQKLDTVGGTITLQHNVPGSYSNINGQFTSNGQLAQFVSTSINRGYILLIRNFTAS